MVKPVNFSVFDCALELYAKGNVTDVHVGVAVEEEDVEVVES